RNFENSIDPDPVTAANLDEYRMLDEWGTEFLGEGRRRTDLIRWNKFTTERWWDHEPSADYLRRFPVPTRAVSGNNNLTQNPGYYAPAEHIRIKHSPRNNIFRGLNSEKLRNLLWSSQCYRTEVRNNTKPHRHISDRVRFQSRNRVRLHDDGIIGFLQARDQKESVGIRDSACGIRIADRINDS